MEMRATSHNARGARAPFGAIVKAALSAIASVVIATGALTGVDAVAAPPAAEAQSVSGDGLTHREFYTPPAELPPTPGTMLKTEPMGLVAQGLPGLWQADAERIMYTSVGATGAIVPVTGVYVRNHRPPLGGGARPLAIIAPGTQGAGDQCAPSRSLETGFNVATDNLSVAVGYEALAVWSLINRGFDVVLTDYEGLGTPGQHTYVNGISEAHAVLDAARATIGQSAGRLSLDSPVVISGYSQGGGAAARAAELESTYAPELSVRGVNAGAPPVDLAATLARINGSLIVGVVGYAMNSFIASDPSLRPLLAEHLNDAGMAALERSATQCNADSVLTDGLRNTTQWTNNGESAEDSLLEIPLARAIVDEQRIGTIAPQVPVRVQGNVNDDVVPYAPIKELVQSWCAGGTPVQFVTDDLPPIAPGFALNHLVPYLTHADEVSTYLADRVLGRPAPNTCQG